MTTPIHITLTDTHLRLSRNGTEESRPKKPESEARFTDWTQRYAGGMAKWGERSKIGHELWQWLDDGWLTRCRNDTPNELWFEFAVDGGVPSFLDVPWELLKDDKGFLAERDGMLFSVIRRLLPAQESLPPSPYRPAVVFMAGDPRDTEVPLNYDAEEQAILLAIGTAGVDFLCEDNP